MADPSKPCQCVPYKNICCCAPKGGISVIQPECQTLPDGSVIINPAYVVESNKSYWSYKFFTDCSDNTRGISSIVIPICEIITLDFIEVWERIDGCGQFVKLPKTDGVIEIKKEFPNFGEAPQGFKYLKIEVQDRYEKGVCVEYLLELIGNFPVAIQPIKIKAANNIITFGCESCFLVPECNPEGKLIVMKECDHTIIDNQATLNYRIEVGNIGDAPLENVQFKDTIVIPTQLSFGSIIVNPPTLNVDTSIPGQIIINGNLGTINPGDHVDITYTIPITAISVPGRYIINNIATASATGTEAVAKCLTNLDAVMLNSNKCCQITDGKIGKFKIVISNVGNSPVTLVDIVDFIMIPGGVVVQFKDFGGCTATFSGTADPVPTNQNIVGPVGIDIKCNSVLIPQNGSVEKIITLELISSSLVGTVFISNELSAVTLTNPSEQVFMGAGELPIDANIAVKLLLDCLKPCD